VFKRIIFAAILTVQMVALAGVTQRELPIPDCFPCVVSPR
jgi:hypothetical protein